MPARSDVMMILYPETAFEEVIEANRRRTWTVNAVNRKLTHYRAVEVS
jgi:RPA family protein